MSRVKTNYLHKFQSAVDAPKAKKGAYLQIVAMNVDDYLSAHPDADMTELEAALGAPEAFGEDYLASLETKELQAMIRRAKLRKRIVIGMCCGLLALLLAWSAYTLINLYLHTHDSYFVTEVIVNERIEDDDSIENTESEAVAP